MGVSILGFQISPRTNYDRGDCDCILILTDTSTVESLPHFSTDYYFIPDTTVNQLLVATNQYPIGTVGALVVGAKKIGSQYAIDIKDGIIESDIAQVQMSHQHMPLIHSNIFL